MCGRQAPEGSVMRRSFEVSLAIVSFASATTQALAHHGIVNFDLNKDIEITGVVTDLAFVNPHSWLYLSVTSADGTVTPWRCEMRAATVLRRSGWSEEWFANGSQVRITG